jgi:hypothetical protein
VTTPVLVLILTVGAAALALWTSIRFGGIAPQGMRVSVVHICVALALVNLVVPQLMQPIIGDGESVPRILVALFGVFLPALVYAFLSGLWALSRFGQALRLR